MIRFCVCDATFDCGVFSGAMRRFGTGVGSGTTDNGRIVGTGTAGWKGMIGRKTPLGENGCGNGVGSVGKLCPRTAATDIKSITAATQACRI